MVLASRYGDVEADALLDDALAFAKAHVPEVALARGKTASAPAAPDDRRHRSPSIFAPTAGDAGGVLEVRGYVRVRDIWRSLATRRRSRRAASFATARRVAQ